MTEKVRSVTDERTARIHSLPETEAVLLRRLRDESLTLLRARVALLREAKWTLAAIGAPIGANRSTTRLWQMQAADDDLAAARNLAPVPVAPPRPVTHRVMRKYPDVPGHDRQRLHTLAAAARKVRGWSAPDSPECKAAQELEDALLRYTGLGVPHKRLADHMGVTHRAVAARLERVEAREKVAS